MTKDELLVRKIVPNIFEHETEPNLYPSNRRKTRRFTWWTFLPMALMLQLRRIAVLLFVVASSLQYIPEISTSPMPIMGTIPVIILIFFGILKEGLTELRYSRDDYRINHQVYKKVKITSSDKITRLDTETYSLRVD